MAWVAERKNLLSAGFWLLTIWAYVRYAEVRSQKEEGRMQNPDPSHTQDVSLITHHASRYYSFPFSASLWG